MIACIHDPVQGAQVQPQVIGVEEPVPPDVLERLHVGGGALCGFPQDQRTVRVPRQVPALAIGFRAVRDLHKERHI